MPPNRGILALLTKSRELPLIFKILETIVINTPPPRDLGAEKWSGGGVFMMIVTVYNITYSDFNFIFYTLRTKK